MKLSYEEKGQGEVLVFLHSYLWDREMWREQIDSLSQSYRCISIDLPSHGKSIAKLEKGYSLSCLAKDVYDFLQEKGIEEYHYIGLSVGGMLAPYLYELSGEKIKTFVIMDSYSGAEGIEKKELYFSLLDAIETLGQIPPTMAEQIAKMFFAENRKTEQNPDYVNFVRRLTEMEKERIRDIVILGRAIFGREDKRKTVSEIKAPVYFIVGEEDEPRPPKESEEMARLVEGSQCIIVPKAGHISNRDHAEYVNRILGNIFKK